MLPGIFNVVRLKAAQVLALEPEVAQGIPNDGRDLFRVPIFTSTIRALHPFVSRLETFFIGCTARIVKKIAALQVPADHWLYDDLSADLANVVCKVV